MIWDLWIRFELWHVYCMFLNQNYEHEVKGVIKVYIKHYPQPHRFHNSHHKIK